MATYPVPATGAPESAGAPLPDGVPQPADGSAAAIQPERGSASAVQSLPGGATWPAEHLAALVRGCPARLGDTRLLLVDGPSGAGKTVLAERLAEVLGADAVTVHTDDLLDGWDDQFTYWPRLWQQVLDPVRRGRSGRYRRYDWNAGAFAGEPVPVRPGGILIVEGVGCAREVGRQWATLSVYVTAPSEVCRARSLVRDGPEPQRYLDVWRQREAVHFAADGTAAAVDVVVDGCTGQYASTVARPAPDSLAPAAPGPSGVRSAGDRVSGPAGRRITP